MNDEQLSQLFRTGTATDRDVEFVDRTNRRIWSLKQISALMIAVRVCCVIMLAVGLLVLTQTYQLTFMNDRGPALISIVLPLLVAVACATFIATRRYAR